jgi:hypothetical protein
VNDEKWGGFDTAFHEVFPSWGPFAVSPYRHASSSSESAHVDDPVTKVE